MNDCLLGFQKEWRCHWVNRNGCLLEWDLTEETSVPSIAGLEIAFSTHLCSPAFERHNTPISEKFDA
jgi:hypothetical protein